MAWTPEYRVAYDPTWKRPELPEWEKKAYQQAWYNPNLRYTYALGSELNEKPPSMASQPLGPFSGIFSSNPLVGAASWVAGGFFGGDGGWFRSTKDDVNEPLLQLTNPKWLEREIQNRATRFRQSVLYPYSNPHPPMEIFGDWEKPPIPNMKPGANNPSYEYLNQAFQKEWQQNSGMNKYVRGLIETYGASQRGKGLFPVLTVGRGRPGSRNEKGEYIISGPITWKKPTTPAKEPETLLQRQKYTPPRLGYQSSSLAALAAGRGLGI